MTKQIVINGKQIGAGWHVYIVAEMSANHHQNFEQAVRILKAVKEAGADAVKLQTAKPDTITIDCDNGYFRVGKGTLWENRSLFDLYTETYTPWDWQPKLKEIVEVLGSDLFF